MDKAIAIVFSSLVFMSAAQAQLDSRIVKFNETIRADQIELKNDNYVESGAPAYLQQGFVKGEKAGVWLAVPKTIKAFKIDAFRILIGGGRESRLEVFFQMGTASEGQCVAAIPREIENAAIVTPGPYWNDIPARGVNGPMGCASGGQLIGAAIEFTHEGVPSVYRDSDGLNSPRFNTLYAIPGGWNYSVSIGLTGDWILRVIGHEAKSGECRSY